MHPLQYALLARYLLSLQKNTGSMCASLLLGQTHPTKALVISLSILKVNKQNIPATYQAYSHRCLHIFIKVPTANIKLTIVPIGIVHSLTQEQPMLEIACNLSTLDDKE